MAVEGQYEIRTIITRGPISTTAKKVEDGLELDIVVLVGGEAELHRFTVGEQGIKAIQNALFPSLVIPDTIPPEELTG